MALIKMATRGISAPVHPPTLQLRISPFCKNAYLDFLSSEIAGTSCVITIASRR